MTEIKTAQAWGWLRPNGKLVDAWVETETIGDPQNAPVVIVHGQTEAEVHDAAALRSACRELCIETVEQLKARLAPDPRVEEVIIDLQNLHGGGTLPSSLDREVVGMIDKLIAAQRGEVDG